MEPSEWAWSIDHRQACRIVEAHDLWGQTIYRVWLPGRDSVVRIPASRLKSLDGRGTGSPDNIAYIAAGARLADALTQDVLLAPIESSVIPLPHQIKALSTAVSSDRVRYLLADEVGLGKTIEAGLIMRELKQRGLVARTLVIAPKGLVTQWVAEMRTHFGEEFRLVIPGDISAYKRFLNNDNVWRSHHQIVCSIDSVKPLDNRRGWSYEQVAEYNRERFEDLIAAGWDLVIVDEAHRLGGSTEQIARYRLGRALAESAPYVLLLSATPHQGKTDAFHRLISLIDPEAFPDIESVARERVQPYVIRSEKRRAITAEGKPLFKPRRTQLFPVSWQERHRGQRLLYDAVTGYVREGYNQAVREKKSYIGFLMVLMQRLVTSSTHAIRATLERRLEALQAPEEQMTFFPVFDEDWTDLDGQEQIETLLRTRLTAFKDEREEVKLILKAAKHCEETGPDAKAEALLDWIYRLQQEEGVADLKILVFTEFIPTQGMLETFLTDRGFSVVCLNGSMDMQERIRAQETFSREARILISTDAGGEGLNLQFCHVVINYDIPWNPMRLEQRIGRVDRIGQEHPVRAVNFVFEGTIEHRVRQVLEEKLAVILKEFGMDKAGDVLDSAEAGKIFDELYVEAILRPEAIDSTVEKVIDQIHGQAKESRDATVLRGEDEFDPHEAQRLMSHPLPHWVELMTTSYLRAHGGKAEKSGSTWKLTWPDGKTLSGVVFTSKEAGEIAGSRLLTLEDARVRNLMARMPRFVPGQPIPRVSLSDISEEIMGFWSLWKISLHADDWNRQRIMPLFLHDDGRFLPPTARHVWDRLLSGAPEISGYIEGEQTRPVYDRILEEAETHGRPVYEELLQAHKERINRDLGRGEHAFAARRRAVERIGLPAVRKHRLALLEQEEREWRASTNRKVQASPELIPLIIVRLGE